MDDQNTLNIPAYQRKRSILAKARRGAFYQNDAPVKRKPLRATRKARPATTAAPIHSDIPVRPVASLSELFPSQSYNSSPPPTPSQTPEVREMKICGICEGYFEKIDVAVIKVTSPLRTGDRIIFEKQDGLFEQSIDSIQLDRKPVTLAKTGTEIGIKVKLKPNVGTNVYKVIE